MSAISEFFQHKASNFTKGDHSLVREVMKFPCQILLGDKEVTYQNAGEVEAHMERYRTNLKHSDYSHTSAETLLENPKRGSLQNALVKFTHHASSGAKIGSLEARYFVEITGAQRPRVHVVEFLEPFH